MNLSLDVMREISYYLLPYKLSLSIELNNLYDENWFKNELLSKYPACKKNKNLWKELYKKSLKSGNIYTYTYDNLVKKIINIENIQGIKVSYIGNIYLILTFDGDLYVVNDENLQKELIDVNVNDIDGNSYIKENKFYCVRNKIPIKPHLIAESDSDFISVLDTGSYCAITKDKFYYMREQMPQKLKIIDCPGASKLIYSSSIIVQLENKDIKVFNSRYFFFHKLDIKNIENIYPGIAQMSDNKLINFKCSYAINCLNTITEPINTEHINTCMKKLTGASYLTNIIVLIDGSIYKLDKSELKHVTNNVKNICNGNFIIK
jgi:hypothetical protein